MEQTTWWQILVLILGAVGGLEFIKWIFNRKTENRLNKLEVRQKDFDLDEKRIAELHASIDKANELNDNLLARLSNANAAIDKHIDRNRKLSDRLYEAEQEVNRVNDVLTEEQHKTATLERRLGAAMRIADHYKQWRCERSDCQDPRGRRPPNPSLRGKVYTKPQNLEKEQEDTTTLNSESK
jgi:DNA repair exonuclease SbcCD ATPase subunit